MDVDWLIVSCPGKVRTSNQPTQNKLPSTIFNTQIDQHPGWEPFMVSAS